MNPVQISETPFFCRLHASRQFVRTLPLLVILLWGALGAVPLSHADSAERPDRPNIIFILADDLGYGDIGILWQNSVAGEKKLRSPNFDRMAREGMILNQHYTGAPVCAPARGSEATLPY